MTPRERERARAIANELKRRANKPTFAFRGAAQAIQSCRVPEWIISGPAETGKTLACLALLDHLARRYPRAQGAILRKVHRDLFGTVIKLYRDLFERDGVTPFGGEKPDWFDYPNGARVYVGGLDRPGAFLSGSLDFAYLNQAEETNITDWEMLTTRTTGRAGHVDFGGMTFGDCNPGPPSHWIKSRLTLKLFESRHEDNPRLFDDQGHITEQGQRSLSVLDALTGVRKERLRYGRWVQAEGAVYDFDAAVHLIDPFPIPPEWRRLRAIDFGFTNPFVCHWWALDDDDRMYLYREIYMSQRTVNVHAPKIKALSAGERYQATVCDHDAEDRATLDEHGIHSEPAIKDVSRGIQAVQDRLKLAGDGKPRLFVMRGCTVEMDERLAEVFKPTSTEKEFDSYMWPKDAGGRPVKEAPVKVDDHGMDDMRYAVMYVDGSGGPAYGESVYAQQYTIGASAY